MRLLPSMFHVKHSTLATTSDARSPRPMFHVKHRGVLVSALAVFALLGSACATIQSPEGWAAPVELDGEVLAQSNKGQVTLVDPATGQVGWTYPEDDSGDRTFYATPIVDGSSVYLADYSGRVTRLNVGSGDPTQAWATELDAPVVATPVLDGGRLYVPTSEGRIAIIDVAEGLVVETIQTSDRRIWGAPALQGSTIYLGDLDNGATVALSTPSGDLVWEQSISGPTAADLALDGDLLLVGAFDQHLHALEVANNGNERWAFEGDGWFLARPLVQSGVVYAATMNGFVYAIDRASGSEVWSFEAEDAEFRAAPVLVGGNLVAVARDGRVFALNLSSGAVAWEQDATTDGNVNANPLVIDNEIYLVTSQHDLVRVDASRGGAFQNVPLAADR